MSTSARHGKLLHTTGKKINDGEMILYRASTYDCRPLSAKPAKMLPNRRSAESRAVSTRRP